MPFDPTPASFDRNIAFNQKTGEAVLKNRTTTTIGLIGAWIIGGALMVFGLALALTAFSVGRGFSDLMFWVGALLAVGGVLCFRKPWVFGGWAGYCPACGAPVFVQSGPEGGAAGSDCPACKSRVVLRGESFIVVK